MGTIAERTLAIRVDEDFYKKVKRRLAENGMTLKDYFVSLVENDVETNDNQSIEGYTRQEVIDQANEITRLLQIIANE